jgi:hypothetical protein
MFFFVTLVSFIYNTVCSLNAEVVAGSVTDAASCVSWLLATFLAVVSRVVAVSVRI